MRSSPRTAWAFGLVAAALWSPHFFMVESLRAGGVSALAIAFHLLLWPAAACAGLVFLGGGYMPLSQFGGLMEKLADYSPVGMINQGMIDYIYTNQFSGMLRAMAFTGSLGIVMLLIAYMLYKREEGSHRVAGA